MTTHNLPATQKAQSIRQLFESPTVKSQLGKAIARHMKVERLLRVAMTSIQQNEKLLDCSQRSLLGCLMVCAELGLEPSNFLGQAYLVPYWNKKKSCFEAQLIPGYRGYLALARRTGQVQTVSAQVVYQNDTFELEYGIEDKLRHVPAPGDRGKPVGAYVVFRYKDGAYSFDYMTVDDIEKIRQRSKAADSGPWVTDWAEMAKKTVIRRHVKLAPLSVEFQTATALEDLAHAGESQMPLLEDGGNGHEAIDIGPEQPAMVADTLETFGRTIPEGTDPDQLQRFLEINAKANNTTVEAVKIQAVEQHERFYSAFSKWCHRQAAKQSQDGLGTNGEASEGMDEWGAFRNEWINLRSGFADYVWKNKVRFAEAPEGIRQEARDKWARGKDTKDHPFPLDKLISEAPVAEPEPKTMEKENPLGKMVTCPDRDGDNMAEAFCNEQCSKRQGCPAWDDDGGF